MRYNLLPPSLQHLTLMFPPCGPLPPHPIMLVSFLKLRWVAWGLGCWGHYPQALVQVRAQLRVRQGGTLCLVAQCRVRAAGSGSGAWSSCVILWMRTRALPVPLGDPPIGWARVHVTDMWLYWRNPPRCHWRRNGGAAGLGNGVGAGATMARLAAEGRGDYFSSYCLKTGGFSLAQGSLPHAKCGGRGVSLPPPFYCSTGDGFPVFLILGFWQKRKKGGGVGVLRGAWWERAIFEAKRLFLFL